MGAVLRHGIDVTGERASRAVVIEHEAAAQRCTEQRVTVDLQPTTYALATPEMGLPGVSRIEDVEAAASTS